MRGLCGRSGPWRPASKQTLRTWIHAQLKTQYGLGQSHIDEIEARGLVLLLDGLDEVCPEHRASCVRAINDHCTVVWWNWTLPGLFSLTLFFLLVLGMGWGEVVLRDDVDLPNQGIIDSGRNGIIVAAGGIIAGLLYGLAIGLPCFFGLGFKASNEVCASGELGSLFSGLGIGIGIGAILGLIFGQIFGGFAWFRHYLIRALLYLDRRQIPWQLEWFLAHAADLHLLRRVGGGFEFIDQDLQTYFERIDPHTTTLPTKKAPSGGTS